MERGAGRKRGRVVSYLLFMQVFSLQLLNRSLIGVITVILNRLRCNATMSSSEKIIGKKRLINPVSEWMASGLFYFDGPDVTLRAKTDQISR